MENDKNKVEEAIKILITDGNVDGSHHKTWVIDQVLRVLMGEIPYQEWVSELRNSGFDWDEGIAP
jgi:hypothetical protein